MSVAFANAFSLLDDEGTTDAGALVAKIPVKKNEAPAASQQAPKAGKLWVRL